MNLDHVWHLDNKNCKYAALHSVRGSTAPTHAPGGSNNYWLVLSFVAGAEDALDHTRGNRVSGVCPCTADRFAAAPFKACRTMIALRGAAEIGSEMPL